MRHEQIPKRWISDRIAPMSQHHVCDETKDDGAIDCSIWSGIDGHRHKSFLPVSEPCPQGAVAPIRLAVSPPPTGTAPHLPSPMSLSQGGWWLAEVNVLMGPMEQIRGSIERVDGLFGTTLLQCHRLQKVLHARRLPRVESSCERHYLSRSSTSYKVY